MVAHACYPHNSFIYCCLSTQEAEASQASLGYKVRHCLKKFKVARYQWLTLVILATWEAETRRIMIQGQSRQIVCEIPSPK
jgi:hypothetical protein